MLKWFFEKRILVNGLDPINTKITYNKNKKAMHEEAPEGKKWVICRSVMRNGKRRFKANGGFYKFLVDI